MRAIRNLDVSPDDRLDHVSLRLGVQFRDVRERGVIHVVLPSPLVVTIVVTLVAVADRMIPVVTRALGRETDADRRFVRRFAILMFQRASLTINPFNSSNMRFRARNFYILI